MQFLTDPLVLHQTDAKQHCQVIGRGGTGQSDLFGQLATDGRLDRQKLDDLHPFFFRQHLEKLLSFLASFFTGSLLADECTVNQHKVVLFWLQDIGEDFRKRIWYQVDPLGWLQNLRADFQVIRNEIFRVRQTGFAAFLHLRPIQRFEFIHIVSKHLNIALQQIHQPLPGILGVPEDFQGFFSVGGRYGGAV